MRTTLAFLALGVFFDQVSFDGYYREKVIFAAMDIFHQLVGLNWHFLQ